MERSLFNNTGFETQIFLIVFVSNLLRKGLGCWLQSSPFAFSALNRVRSTFPGKHSHHHSPTP